MSQQSHSQLFEIISELATSSHWDMFAWFTGHIRSQNISVNEYPGRIGGTMFISKRSCGERPAEYRRSETIISMATDVTLMYHTDYNNHFVKLICQQMIRMGNVSQVRATNNW